MSIFVGRPFGNAEVSDVAIGAAGYVAVGATRPDLYTLLAEVWWSPDGQYWEAPGVPELEPETTVLTGVAYDAAHGFVVIGRDDGTGPSGTVGELVVWDSLDGRSWTRAHVADAVLSDPFERLSVAASASGFVIAARDCSAAVCRLRAWRSADGGSWAANEVATFNSLELAQIDAVVASEAGYAIVGASCRHASSTPDVADATDCALFAQKSADGETWRAADGPRSGRCCWSEVYYAAMASDGRLLVDGEVGRTVCRGGDDCLLETLDMPIWTFDGRQWSEINPVLEGIGEADSLGALARSADRWLAIARGVLWASGDGITWTLVDQPFEGIPDYARVSFDSSRGIVVGLSEDSNQHTVWLFDLSGADGTST